MKWYMVFPIVIAMCTVLSIGTALSGPASADVFKAMDKNGDSKVTAQEYLAACERGEEKCTEEFKWFDRNKDGVITLPEYEGKVQK